MNTAQYVDEQIKKLKEQGVPLSDVAWKAALACVGWAYVFGARGQYCTPANRRARYRDDHETIKTACKNYDGSSSAGCKGCKWYPSDKYTRFFDCRGFTYWIIKMVYGWELMGAGATSQWNTADNWQSKGKISDGIPQDTLVCLFYTKKDDPKKMAHTGLYYNGETVECSSGVQHSKTLNKKWTHWGVPAVCDAGEIKPVPDAPETPVNALPTLRRGNKGQFVTLLQTKLKNAGYDLGKYGIDGDFGSATLAAVKAFQKDHGLTVDGVVGKNTWAALENPVPVQLFTVTIPHLTESEADRVIASHEGAYKSIEKG